MRKSHEYKIYHQGNLLMQYVDAGQSQIVPIFCNGINDLNLITQELTISCPVEDVRVERDGVTVELQHAKTWTVDDVTAYFCGVQNDDA